MVISWRLGDIIMTIEIDNIISEIEQVMIVYIKAYRDTDNAIDKHGINCKLIGLAKAVGIINKDHMYEGEIYELLKDEIRDNE